MSFGLFNASTSFQDYINKILAKNLTFLFYLNDILIYTKDPDQDYVNAIR